MENVCAETWIFLHLLHPSPSCVNGTLKKQSSPRSYCFFSTNATSSYISTQNVILEPIFSIFFIITEKMSGLLRENSNILCIFRHALNVNTEAVPALTVNGSWKLHKIFHNIQVFAQQTWNFSQRLGKKKNNWGNIGYKYENLLKKICRTTKWIQGKHCPTCLWVAK